MVRCIPVVSRNIITLRDAEHREDRTPCHLLTYVEHLLIMLGYTLIYLFDRREKVYRKKGVMVIIDYTNCTIETTTTCAELSNTFEKLQKSSVVPE